MEGLQYTQVELAEGCEVHWASNQYSFSLQARAIPHYSVSGVTELTRGR
jgi:hypothetical protein